MSSDYIRTTTNYVNRQAQIDGPQRVEMRGRSIIQEAVTIRGDLAPIRVGHYCFFDAGCVLSPCSTVREGVSSHVPLTIGNMTYIGKDAVIEAAYLGSHVDIGENCVVSARCIIKDCCKLLPGTVLAPDTVLPPFALVSGAPGKVIGELPPSVSVVTREEAMGRYRRMKKMIVEKGGAATKGKGKK